MSFSPIPEIPKGQLHFTGGDMKACSYKCFTVDAQVATRPCDTSPSSHRTSWSQQPKKVDPKHQQGQHQKVRQSSSLSYLNTRSLHLSIFHHFETKFVGKWQNSTGYNKKTSKKFEITIRKSKSKVYIQKQHRPGTVLQELRVVLVALKVDAWEVARQSCYHVWQEAVGDGNAHLKMLDHIPE